MQRFCDRFGPLQPYLASLFGRQLGYVLLYAV